MIRTNENANAFAVPRPIAVVHRRTSKALSTCADDHHRSRLTAVVERTRDPSGRRLESGPPHFVQVNAPFEIMELITHSMIGAAPGA
ncbi:hypothetical protein [Pseudonocardia endophytica]|uniref:hypothetical protein n=1 Tax=Pseudonocardia endophytica TaxID=401976 RepID=UPI001404351D|nr:hypothetical protein [Pseudonocardia endophytica]